MATETLYASGIAATDPAELQGAINALGPIDGNWTTNFGNSSWIAVFAVDNPTAGTEATGTHSISVRVRKEDNSGNGDPTVDYIRLQTAGGGTVLAEGAVSTAVSSISPGYQTVSFTFDSAVLSGYNLNLLEFEISTTAIGGSPSKRSAIQMDAIYWSGDFSAPISNPPVANAGGPQNVEPNTQVFLDGTGSTDDVGIVSWLWEQTGGTTVTINNATTSIADFTPTVEDTYTFQLTVTDGDSQQDTATTTVTVAVAPATGGNASLFVFDGAAEQPATINVWDGASEVLASSFDIITAAAGPAFVQSKQAQGTALSMSVTMDAAPAAGSLLIAYISQQSVNAWTTGAGWTMGTKITNGDEGAFFYKFAGASEPATQEVATNDSGARVWTLAIEEWTGIVNQAPLSDNGVSDSGLTKASPSVTPTASVSAVIFGAAFSTSSTVVFSNETVNLSATGVTSREKISGGSGSNASSADIWDAAEPNTSGSYAVGVDADISESAGINIMIFEAA